LFEESGDGRNFYHLNMMEEWNGNTWTERGGEGKEYCGAKGSE
jgi:hypothetical protein